MARRIFLHVASTKTGTTFLQKVMWAHRDRLAAQGVLLPGQGIRDHFHAAIDVREERHLLRDPEAASGAWRRLVDEMAAWDGDAVVSHELFAPATADQVERATAMLGDAEVHVVVTARDLVRQIPAEWQEHLKHRSVLTFPEFVDQLRNDDQRGPFSPNGYYFWDEQDLSGVVRRWRGSLPGDRVHVVTVPKPGAGPDELWRRFSDLVGIDGEGFDLTSARSNSSVRAEQAELLRRLNAALGPRLPLPGPYPEMVKALLAHRILADRPGSRFGVLGEDRAFAVERSRAMVEELRDLGVDVVGDLGDLVPDGTEEAVSGDAYAAPEEVLDEAVEALAAVLDRLARERSRRQRLSAELDRAKARIRRLERRQQRDTPGATPREVARALARRARRRPR